MKTQIFNTIYNVPINIDNEQFLKVGADLDLYCLVNSKVRSINTVACTVLDLINARDNDGARQFLIATDSTGDYTFPGGTAAEFAAADATGKPYALYDATSMNFVGYYRLDPAKKVVQIADSSTIENSKQYIASIVSDCKNALINEAVKAHAALKGILAKGIDKIMSLAQVDGTANSVVSFSMLANQYTTDIVKFKVAQISAKNWKQLMFPFFTAFAGTWYDLDQNVDITVPRGSETQYMLVFFKDVYGNVSFPFIFVINS